MFTQGLSLWLLAYIKPLTHFVQNHHIPLVPFNLAQFAHFIFWFCLVLCLLSYMYFRLWKNLPTKVPRMFPLIKCSFRHVLKDRRKATWWTHCSTRSVRCWLGQLMLTSSFSRLAKAGPDKFLYFTFTIFILVINMCQTNDLICAIILVLITVWPPGLCICWQFSTLMIITVFAKCQLSVSIIFYIDCLDFYSKKSSYFLPFVYLFNDLYHCGLVHACFTAWVIITPISFAFPIVPDFIKF